MNFLEMSYAVMEGGATMVCAVIISGYLQTEVELVITPTGGSAVGKGQEVCVCVCVCMLAASVEVAGAILVVCS